MMSLRKQFSLVLLVLFLTTLSVIVVVSVTGTRRYLEQQLASHAQDTATALSVTLGQSLGAGDAVLAQANVASMFDRGYFKSITVLGTDRSPIVKSEMAEKIEGVPLWFAAAFPMNTRTGEAFVGSGWKQLGKVLVVSQPTFAYQYLWRTSTELLGWMFGLCVLTGLLIQLILHFILKPLRAIEKTAKDVQAKRFEPIMYRPSAPELATVVVAMNQMSNRVAQMLDEDTAAAQALHTKAYADELTGLANRAGFELALGELLEGDRPFDLGSVVSIELDNMRLLIRAHGFAAGEQVIRIVTQNARTAFGPSPRAILARSNEFSFTFVTDDLTEVQAAERAAELHQKILLELAGNDQATILSVTMGAAFFRHQERRAAVFARADLALESARQAHRHGLVVLNAQPDANSSLGSFAWRNLIKTTLAENRLRLVRQPVMHMGQSGIELQSECFARLVDAEGELIAASSFIPMATRHRLMIEVDRAIVTLALSSLLDNRPGSGATAINLSQQSMADLDFMKWFAGQLASIKDMAARLAIEVPKFGVTADLAAALKLRDLAREHGTKFGVDNFSLDAQGLKLLREVAPDYVKLTGTQIAEMPIGAAELQVLQSFVRMAHSLDAIVIAVQVDRIEQVTALLGAGVDAAQGYYFGEPK